MKHNQLKILYDIYDKFKLNGKKTFMQHRNLKEFNQFRIERINPNHRIILYGKLKRKYVKDGDYNKYIKVGEIFLFSAFIISPFTNILANIVYCFLLAFILDDLITYKNPLEVFYAYRNRGITG